MKFRTIFVYLHFLVAVLLINMVIVGYFSEDIVGVYKIALCVLFSIFSAFFIIFVLLLFSNFLLDLADRALVFLSIDFFFFGVVLF